MVVGRKWQAKKNISGVHRVLYLILSLYLPILRAKYWDELSSQQPYELGAITYTSQIGKLSLGKVPFLDQSESATMCRAKIQKPTLCTPSEDHLLLDSAIAASLLAGGY